MPVMLFYELGVSVDWLAKLRRRAVHLLPRRRRALPHSRNISITQTHSVVGRVAEKGNKGKGSSVGCGPNIVVVNGDRRREADRREKLSREVRLQNVLGVTLMASSKQHEAAIYFQQLNSAWDNNVHRFWELCYQRDRVARGKFQFDHKSYCPLESVTKRAT